jgi:hypothetical protein
VGSSFFPASLPPSLPSSLPPSLPPSSSSSSSFATNASYACSRLVPKAHRVVICCRTEPKHGSHICICCRDAAALRYISERRFSIERLPEAYGGEFLFVVRDFCFWMRDSPLMLSFVAPGTRMCLASAMASAQIQSPAHLFPPPSFLQSPPPPPSPLPPHSDCGTIAFSLSALQLPEHNEIVPNDQCFDRFASFAQHAFYALVCFLSLPFFRCRLAAL